ncbi:MAG: hypothetical protein V1789_01905 [PVC group bacterium]
MRNYLLKLLIYLIIPVLLAGIFIGGYFSGNVRIQELIAPRTNREYGGLENLQNLFLLAIIALAAYGLSRKRLPFEKALLILVLLGGVFILLEEIDYGRHHYRYLIGDPVNDRGKDTNTDLNIHNRGNINQVFKQTLDIGMIAFFVLFPLITWKSGNRMVRYLRPDPLCILTMGIMLMASRSAKAFNIMGLGMDGALRSNTAEFREVIVYYIFLVYLCGLIFRRGFRPEPEE